jgi:O-glycosyl hydrolase
VYDRGPTYADVTEGSGGIWERLRYDWSDPNHIVLTTTDSNVWGGSSGYKRLWAFTAYSRFIRPGAVRVHARAADPNVNITAFRNADGSMVVELLNTGTADVSTSFTTDRPVHRVSTYLTNEAHSVDLMSDVRTPRAHSVSAQLPARSLTTLVLSKAPTR